MLKKLVCIFPRNEVDFCVPGQESITVFDQLSDLDCTGRSSSQIQEFGDLSANEGLAKLLLIKGLCTCFKLTGHISYFNSGPIALKTNLRYFSQVSNQGWIHLTHGRNQATQGIRNPDRGRV